MSCKISGQDSVELLSLFDISVWSALASTDLTLPLTDLRQKLAVVSATSSNLANTFAQFAATDKVSSK
jgi:hypothetical protein